jgi:hypothetical protein
MDVYGCLTQSSPNSNSSAQRSHEGFLAKPLTGCDNEARQAHAAKEGSQTTQFQSYFPFPLKGGRVGRRCQGPFGRHGQPYQGSLRRRPLPRLWSGSERLSAKGRGDCSPSDLRDWLRRMQQRRGSAPFSPVALEARFSSLTPMEPWVPAPSVFLAGARFFVVVRCATAECSGCSARRPRGRRSRRLAQGGRGGEVSGWDGRSEQVGWGGAYGRRAR